MGFRPSAGWAQALTDVATKTAQLPDDRRVRFDWPVPVALPVWGSIQDDICQAVDEVGPETSPETSPAGAWVRSVESSWEDLGVAGKAKKRGNADDPLCELQGAFLHQNEHWLGTSLQRRCSLVCATLYVLGRVRVCVQFVERLVGKHGYCQSFNSCTRSTFQQVYRWIQDHRAQRRAFGALDAAAWSELLMSTILLVDMQTELDVPWCPRVECYDAAPGGHGRAWSCLSLDVVREMARLSDCKYPHTCLHKEHGVELDSEGKCPMKRLVLPKHLHWYTVPRMGGYKHITLEEAEAATWSLESRLQRQHELGSRCLQGGDNAAQVAAFGKGRSASRVGVVVDALLCWLASLFPLTFGCLPAITLLTRPVVCTPLSSVPAMHCLQARPLRMIISSAARRICACSSWDRLHSLVSRSWQLRRLPLNSKLVFPCAQTCGLRNRLKFKLRPWLLNMAPLSLFLTFTRPLNLILIFVVARFSSGCRLLSQLGLLLAPWPGHLVARGVEQGEGLFATLLNHGLQCFMQTRRKNSSVMTPVFSPLLA